MSDQLANAYAEQVSVSHRVHADLFIGDRCFSTVSEIVKAAFLDGLNLRIKNRPLIVCLCGSTKFRVEFEDAERREGLLGRIVLTVSMFGHSGDLLPEQCQDGHPIKAALDDLHKRKIDLADEVLVINVGGYIGNSTRSEIDYAAERGKTIRYLSEEIGR